ncbi:MAG: RIFT barrel domain-containing protein, partial [Planctomycetota bacterium]
MEYDVRRRRRMQMLPAVTLLVLASAVASAQDATGAKGTRIPLTVRSFSGLPIRPTPVWTGVPLPRSAVKDAKALRLVGPGDRPVAAQFDVQATWADGSAKWVLASFAAGRGARRRRRREPEPAALVYTLTDEEAAEAPAPDPAVRVRPDTNDITVT